MSSPCMSGRAGAMNVRILDEASPSVTAVAD
jgi:hypothetical protein